MGNHPSAHQPLERAASRRHSFRFSKKERSPGKRMDRLRRSFRDSFRRRRDPHTPEANKSHQWQADESAVRSATCTFNVKYLGCVEVYESRGMQVCEEALKVLRNSRRRPVRAILHVSGDGLRVVEDETKGLIVDQTIEKVSFCAPDRNHDKGFSYICRDGTTRRWMCHGFLATKESGERLSHAVGCAFAACLERKQRRDKECGVTMTYDMKTSTFTRTGSFRQPSLTERLEDTRERAIDVPAARQVFNPFAIERPHATPSMLERQGSFRGFNQLNQASPFKRQLSLRVNDLPSNFERVRSHSLEPTDLSRLPPALSHQIPIKQKDFIGFDDDDDEVSPIPENVLSEHLQEQQSAQEMSELCQQIISFSMMSNDVNGPLVNKTTSTVAKNQFNNSNTTSTLSGVISSNSLDDLKYQNGQLFGDILSSNNNKNNNSNNNNIDESNPLSSDGMSWHDSSSSAVSSTINHRLTPILNQCSLSPVLPRSSMNSTPAPMNPIASVFETPAASPAFSTASTSSLSSNTAAVNQFKNRSPVPLPATAAAILSDSPNNSLTSASPPPTTAAPATVPSVAAGAPSVSTNMETTTSTVTQSTPVATVQPVPNTTNLPKPDQWLGSLTTQASVPPPIPPAVHPRRAPPLHARALSLGSAALSTNTARTGPADPFDADWAETTARNLSQASTTNPFIVPNTTQAFQVQL